MTHRGLQASSLVLIVVGFVFGSVAYSRWSLPYNSEGRFFDADSGVVHSEDALLVYGALTLSAWLLGVACWVFSRRR